MSAPWLIGRCGLKKTLVPLHLYHKAYRIPIFGSAPRLGTLSRRSFPKPLPPTSLPEGVLVQAELPAALLRASRQTITSASYPRGDLPAWVAGKSTAARRTNWGSPPS